MKYKQRTCESFLLKNISQFPVVVLTGPRQSGKSTLLKHLFQEGWKYVSLDVRGTANRAKDDPDLFIRDIQTNVILDEIQKVPELFHSIKYAVDSEHPHKFILSGSANFLLLSQVAETLAGRVGIVNLFPFSFPEIQETAKHGLLERLIKLSDAKELLAFEKHSAHLETRDLQAAILQGGFPGLLTLKTRDEKSLWFENYRTTYIERDLRDLGQVADIGDFQKYYEMLAYQVGNVLDFSSIARDIGISVGTSRKYFHILETAFQYFLLRPYFANIGKRLIKSPKVYAVDTGLCCFFLRYRDPETLANSGKMGYLFENWVVSEFYKQRSMMPEKPSFYFWRTSNGAEVDLVIEYGDKLIPIEIKYAVSLTAAHTRGMQSFLSAPLKDKAPVGIILYRGNEIFRIKENIVALPIEYLFV